MRQLVSFIGLQVGPQSDNFTRAKEVVVECELSS